MYLLYIIIEAIFVSNTVMVCFTRDAVKLYVLRAFITLKDRLNKEGR